MKTNSRLPVFLRRESITSTRTPFHEFQLWRKVVLDVSGYPVYCICICIGVGLVLCVLFFSFCEDSTLETLKCFSVVEILSLTPRNFPFR